MISTVTTSTVTTITTMIGFGMALGLVAVLVLITLLAVRELATVSEGGSRRRLAKALDIGIVPLIIAFAMIVVMKVVAVLA